MSIRNLHPLFDPRSVAVIGASSTPHSVGATVLHNLIDANFNGAILPVNPKYDTLAGQKVYAKIADLPETPDLAIICTPPDTIAKLIGELGERLTIMTNGGGPGMKAVDALTLAQGRPAALSPDTLHELNAILPATWSGGNPVDIIGDAPVAGLGARNRRSGQRRCRVRDHRALRHERAGAGPYPARQADRVLPPARHPPNRRRSAGVQQRCARPGARFRFSGRRVGRSRHRDVAAGFV